MELSDNISILLTHPQELNINTLPIHSDPLYFKDLKNYLDKNEDYRKARIAWRKFHSEILDMFTVKDRFFEYYKENDLPTFHRDIETFLRNHPELTVEEGAMVFCSKWKGYEKTYGVEFVRRAMERLK